MRDELDRFYTDENVAAKCIDILCNFIDIAPASTIVEPSAGTGSFVIALESHGFDVIGFDIFPSGMEIIDADFLGTTSADYRGSTIFVGNPPFGERSSLAKKFISHCIDNGADTIAFILPDTFRKLTLQHVFPNSWRLVSVTQLDKNSFYMPSGETYGVPTSFFVWTSRSDIMSGINLRELRYPIPSDWRYVTRCDDAADLCINGNNGKVRMPSEITNPKSEHFIECIDKSHVNDIASVFHFALEHKLYRTASSVNGGNYWINRNELNRAYTEAKSMMNNQPV